VRLYMFEHCSLYFRVRMIVALKGLHLQETPVLDDDTDKMVSLVGKRVIPILVKNDGRPMLESMDMVRYIDSLTDPILTNERPEITAWAERIPAKTAVLSWPRYALLPLPEFGTASALEHYKARKRKVMGDLDEHVGNSRKYIDALMPDLEDLGRLIETPEAVSGKVSMDDIRVLPLLRSAAVVKALRFPEKVRVYFETMMARLGYQPLPVI
jgi:glutaredoxin 2